LTASQRILVTGGAGFIGSELVRQLVKAGHHVTVVDNLVNGKRSNLEDLPEDQVTLHVEDIRNVSTIENILEGVSIIFHLACLGVRHSIHSPIENHQVNAEATLELLNLARRLEIEKFVYVSTSEVYGTARTAPMNELHPTQPHTVYGASKLAGECYTRAYHDTYNMNAVVVRPFNSYGPRCHHEGDSGEVIPKFILRSLAGEAMIIFGDGSQTRDFTYVEDTAAGILAAGFMNEAIGKTLNLGSGMEITVKELAERIASITGKNSSSIVYDQPRPGDVLRLFADSSQAQSLLGFSPQVSLEEGLMRLMAWYESSGLDPAQMLEQETSRNWESAPL